MLPIAAFLLAATLPAAAQQSDDVGTLRRQVQELEKRLDALERPRPQEPPAPAPSQPDPFSFADFTWLNGSPRTHSSPLDTKYFTGEFRLDANYTYSANHPKDHTLDGATEVARHNELQVQQLGIGGDLHAENVRGRLMTQFGLYSQTTPRNDASPSRGQWQLDNAYRYVSEAYGGYHWDVLDGVNLDAGLFMSYVGLFSYYNFDNWAYTPSYVSANTPWFFNGLRLQVFPTERLKIEPWLVNGFQTYGMMNEAPGLGVEVLYRPTGALSFTSNDYWGHDALGLPGRKRFHTDDSVEVKYYDRPQALVDKAAFSLTLDAGCEEGGGVSCFGNTAGSPKQAFLGGMVYNRVWLQHDRFGVTAGGGAITNPGRYLALLPPINGATAASGSPYFSTNPADSFKAWDCSLTVDYMPKDFITWRLELNHRAANVPYFAGAGGMTPPGGNTGTPGTAVGGWAPDLRKLENRLTLAVLVKI